jgi:rRNA pseudouridine-1189 N-methylase Emg1 (Nep1/Mra1 family)
MYSRKKVIRAAIDWGLEPNAHIRGRKDIHHNILMNYAKSKLKDAAQSKAFIDYVRGLHGA